MGKLGKRAKALAVLIGALPTGALAQTDKPICRGESRPDTKTIISDVLTQNTDGSRYVDRRVLLSPISVSPSGTVVGTDAKTPVLVFSFHIYRDTIAVSDNVYASGFDAALTHVAPSVDGIGFDGTYHYSDGSSGPLLLGYLPAGGGGVHSIGATDTGLKEAHVFYSSENLANMILEPGQTLELKVASIEPFEFNGSYEDRDAALHDYERKEALPYFKATISYDRQAQYNATLLSSGPALDLIRKNEAGECEAEKRECFLTTASCDVIGLADDCWELRTLRRFRDGWLSEQKDGAEDIARYYRDAPQIAQRLRNNPSAAVKEYWRFILPSAIAASLGANKTARNLYTRGMNRLMATPALT